MINSIIEFQKAVFHCVCSYAYIATHSYLKTKDYKEFQDMWFSERWTFPSEHNLLLSLNEFVLLPAFSPVRLYSAEDESTSKPQLLPHKHEIITLLGVGGHWITTEKNLQVKILSHKLIYQHYICVHVYIWMCLSASVMTKCSPLLNWFSIKFSHPDNSKYLMGRIMNVFIFLWDNFGAVFF